MACNLAEVVLSHIFLTSTLFLLHVHVVGYKYFFFGILACAKLNVMKYPALKNPIAGLKKQISGKIRLSTTQITFLC